MILTYTRVPADGFDDFIHDEELVSEVLFSMDFTREDLMQMVAGGSDLDPEVLFHTIQGRWSGEEPTFSLEKEWHLLHFLLTGDATLTVSGKTPLHDVVIGGRETHIDAPHGPVRALTPDQSARISAALSAVQLEDLQGKADLESINQAGIYPCDDEWTPTDLDALWQLYPALVTFFQTAADAEEFVLIACS